MNIIIPLGGKGERFRKEGYTDPKPLIKVLGKEILFHVIDNLNVCENDKIFIIYNIELDNDNFSDIITTKYPEIKLIKLMNDTKGAAETVYIGLSEIIKNYSYAKKTLLIDGDTFYTSNIVDKFRVIDNNAVFYTINTNPNPIFSYIVMNEFDIINDIKEKKKISDNANTGAYAFCDIMQLYNYSKYVVDNDIRFNNECYTSCIIDEMINQKELFTGIKLEDDDVCVLGTPLQVREFEQKERN
jgi:dTDP-glucose pyrophosphorylase